MFQLELLCLLPKQQNPESWVHWVLEPGLPSLAEFVKKIKSQTLARKQDGGRTNIFNKYISILGKICTEEKFDGKNLLIINHKTLTKK